MDHGYVAVRDIETTPDHPGFGGPVVPGTWTIRKQANTGWWLGTTDTGSEWAAYVINTLGGGLLVAAWAEQARLEEIAAARDDVMPGREAWRRGYDHGGGPIDSDTPLGGSQEATARQMLRACRWYRCDVIEDDGGGPTPKLDVVRRLSASGVLLPNLNTNPLPWDLDDSGAEVPAGSAVRRVTRLVRPALYTTLAGHTPYTGRASLGDVLEAEPDRLTA
jgi:hypothetical protein